MAENVTCRDRPCDKSEWICDFEHAPCGRLCKILSNFPQASVGYQDLGRPMTGGVFLWIPRGNVSWSREELTALYELSYINLG
jgi:hypothetical protein